MEKEDQDLKDEETVEEESASEDTDSKGSEALENSEIKGRADALLKDGTSAEKNISISKKKYDELRGVEDFMKGHAPLIEKVRQNPDLVNKFMGEDAGTDLEARLNRLEAERKAEKRNELNQAVQEALSAYGADFEKSWGEISGDVYRAIGEKGMKPLEAVRRYYIAHRPEVAQQEAERAAKEALNQSGTFSLGGSRPVNVSKIASTSKLSEVEKKAGRQLGYKNDEEYAKVLDKWKDYLDAHGFSTPA